MSEGFAGHDRLNQWNDTVFGFAEAIRDLLYLFFIGETERATEPPSEEFSGQCFRKIIFPMSDQIFLELIDAVDGDSIGQGGLRVFRIPPLPDGIEAFEG